VIVDDQTWMAGPTRGPGDIEKPCQVFDAMTRMTGGICLVNSRRTSAPVRQLEQVLQLLRSR
jgi:hypothetical protein